MFPFLFRFSEFSVFGFPFHHLDSVLSGAAVVSFTGSAALVFARFLAGVLEMRAVLCCTVFLPRTVQRKVVELVGI